MKNPITKLFHWYFNKKMMPYWALFLLDCLIVYTSINLAALIRDGVHLVWHKGMELQFYFLIYLLFYIICFRIFHTYARLVRYTSLRDLRSIICANLLASAMIIVVRLGMIKWNAAHASDPRLQFDGFVDPSFQYRMYNILFVFILATLLMFGIRMFVRYMFEVLRREGDIKRVFIYGAKNMGMSIANAINDDSNSRFEVKGFFADEKELIGHIIMGQHVYANDNDLMRIMQKKRINAIIVSPLKIETLKDNVDLIDRLSDAGIKIYLMPNIREFDEAQNFSQTQLKEFQIEDLLYRDPITIDMNPIAEQLGGECVMVTGAAGSIGSEIVRQLAALKPSNLVLVDQAETPMHDMRLMLKKIFPNVTAETIVATIVNEERMEAIFAAYKPGYVFHAAAYKHVPMMEDNVSESIQNNVHGTQIIANLSVKYGVKKFVMISTDKAVNPTNVMGCSKRLCEIYVQSLDKYLKETGKGNTQFITTRFGNVLGSNGSVIPLFRQQIASGGPVTVTHPDIIRFFMTIPEACRLVLTAGCMGRGGEIYVFDMGKPVKIADLAKRMILLSGAHNVKIVYTGLRDGEKLYEEVLSNEEGNKPTSHGKIKIASVREYDYNEVKQEFDQLEKISYSFDEMKIVKQMMFLVPEYHTTTERFAQLQTADKDENTGNGSCGLHRLANG